MSSVVCLGGGGIKGAVAAARLAHDHNLVLLHFDFGQPSSRAEANAAGIVAASFPSARVITVDLPHALQLNEHLERRHERAGARPVPSATQASISAALQGFFPVILSAGVHCALQVGARRVVTGLVGQQDASHVGQQLVDGQPGRWREFLHAYEIMLETALPQRSVIGVDAPLIDLSYAEVIKLAFHFHLPVEELWSCRRPGPRPCKSCGSCKARTRAFTEAHIDDPQASRVGV